jgi:hypothetical protein
MRPGRELFLVELRVFPRVDSPCVVPRSSAAEIPLAPRCVPPEPVETADRPMIVASVAPIRWHEITTRPTFLWRARRLPSQRWLWCGRRRRLRDASVHHLRLRRQVRAAPTARAGSIGSVASFSPSRDQSGCIPRTGRQPTNGDNNNNNEGRSSSRRRCWRVYYLRLAFGDRAARNVRDTVKVPTPDFTKHLRVHRTRYQYRATTWAWKARRVVTAESASTGPTSHYATP